jgi:hypothetical protein
MMMLLILIFGLVHLATLIKGQAFILSEALIYAPRIGMCVTPDTYNGPFVNVTQCGFRSDGCNSTTGFCVLAQILGYSVTPVFMNIQVTGYAATMPGESDGAVTVTISYYNSSIFSPEGILQLWGLQTTINGVDVYQFANREVYLTSPNPAPQTFTFWDLPATKYIAIFWDWGGTRYGNGNPESSLPVYVLNVFPVRINLQLEVIPQTNTSSQGYTTIVYQDTFISTPIQQFISYQLTGASNLLGYINNAAAPPYNRQPMWVWRTDKGNPITVLDVPLEHCFVGYKLKYSTTVGSPFCNVLQNVSTGITECFGGDMSKFKIYPMNTGGYGVANPSQPLGPNNVYTVTRKARKTVIEFRLMYSGLVGSSTQDFWAHRQQYFPTTVVAARKLDQIQLDCSASPNLSGPGISVSNYIAPVSAHEDLFVSYYVIAMTSGANPNFVGANFGGYTGLSQFYMEDYTLADVDVSGDGINNFLGGTAGFIHLPWFTDHTNNEAFNDYSCWAVSSNYAGQYNSGGSWGTECGSCPDEFTFADITYDILQAEDFNGECAEYWENSLNTEFTCVPGGTGGGGADHCTDNVFGRGICCPLPGGGCSILCAQDGCCDSVRGCYSTTVCDDCCALLNQVGEVAVGDPTYPYGARPFACSASPVANYLSPHPQAYVAGIVGTSAYCSQDNLLGADGAVPIGRKFQNVGLPAPGIYAGGYNDVDGLSTESNPTFALWPTIKDCVVSSNVANPPSTLLPFYNYAAADNNHRGNLFVAPYRQRILTAEPVTAYVSSGHLDNVPIFMVPPVPGTPLPTGPAIPAESPIYTGFIFPFGNSLSVPNSACATTAAGPYFGGGCNFNYITNSRGQYQLRPWTYVNGVTVADTSPCGAVTDSSCHFPGNACPNPYYEYTTANIFTIGADTQTATFKYAQYYNTKGGPTSPTDPDNADYYVYFTQMFSTYARFLQYPRINPHGFSNAIFPTMAAPQPLITYEFRISCSNQEMGYGPLQGYCAQGWYMTNQFGDPIVVAVIQGSLETNATIIAATGQPYGQVLGPVKTDAVFILQIEWKNNDVLHWEFVLPPEAEWPYVANPSIISSTFCHYSTADSPSSTPTSRYQFVPDPVTVPVPPQEYVLLPMILNVVAEPPACEYDPPEVKADVARGQYMSFAAINQLNLQTVTSTGSNVQTQLYYYYDWTVGTGPSATTIEGFQANAETYTPPMMVKVYDGVTYIVETTFSLIPPNPLYPNPLFRPPRCVGETLSNASCPVNLMDNPMYSGIDQWPYCAPTGPFTPGVNSVLLTPRFIFIPPYTYSGNVGSCFFNRTTAYIDPFIEDQLYGNIFEDCETIPFVVSQITDPTGSVWISLKVRYGITIQSLFNLPCWERLITEVFILSSFVISPQSIVAIPGCVRTDGCCYRQPFVVEGTSPYTGLPINFDNTTDPCYGTGPCLYEIIVSPPANALGGLCLGVTYTFTVQSPAALVANRTGPALFPQFPYPWRCPATVQITLPRGGFSPLNMLLTPGPCDNRGTDVAFTVNYEEVTCSGPISAANLNPNCQLDLWFALQNVDGNQSYFLAGAPGLNPLGPGPGPYKIYGVYTLAYNTPGLFEFPLFYSIPGFASVPNGYWNAFFWTQPAGQTPNLGAVTDPRNQVQAQFIASLKNDQGLQVIRTYFNKPQCPGAPIQINFTVTDIAWNGPYVITWLTPNNEVIATETIPFSFCPGFGILPVAEVLTACALVMQSTGIQVGAQLGTGLVSNGESGLYTLSVLAQGSDCPAEYQEVINAFTALTLQIECQPTTCPGGRDGNANTEVTGGTQKPVINITQYQGSNFDVWDPLYFYTWSTPQGPAVVPDVLRVPEGLYVVNVTDFNGCKVNGSCVVTSRSPPMSFFPVAQTPPNCTGQLGTANFSVVGGIPPYSLYKISNRSIFVSNSYTILSDSTVIPNQNATYVVIDSLGCISPQVSFFLEGPITFFLNLVVVAYPCDPVSATGQIRADVPGGVGAALVWTNLLTGQVVSSSTNCLLNSNCLVISNLPASTYQVVATSSIYGCSQTATIALTARAPPVIQVTRQQDPNSAFLDQLFGSFFSANGPPYTVTFFGIDFSVPLPQRPVFTQEPPSGSLQFWTLFNLPAQTTFQMTVVDAGRCQSTITSLGRQITIVDNVQTPTPIPHQHTVGPTPVPPPHVHINPNDAILYLILNVVIGLGVLTVVAIIGFTYRSRT